MAVYARAAWRVQVFCLTVTEASEEHEDMSIKAFIFACFSVASVAIFFTGQITPVSNEPVHSNSSG
jgi:hypothetical protein